MTDEARRSRHFGWTAQAVWALFGLAIEGAHGFKLGVYLDDDLRHTLLSLAPCARRDFGSGRAGVRGRGVPIHRR